MHYEHFFADVDANRDNVIESAVLELAVLGRLLGLTTSDLALLLRSGLSLEELVGYMTDQLMGRIQ